MEHLIMFDDEPESFVCAPYRNDAGQLIGLTFAIRTPVWQDFAAIGMTWKLEIINSLAENWGTRFWQLPHDLQLDYCFGFRRGIRIDRSDLDWTIIRILFQKEERRGFSTALNLHWLLNRLFTSSIKSSTQYGVSQLFVVGTSVAINPTLHGFAVWVTVSKHCAGLIDTIPENTDFPEARRLIAEAWRYYGIRTARAESMQAHVRNKGILQISAGGDCNCLGTNPDERYMPDGYSMFSHNTDGAMHQITLLVGLAAIWMELRGKLQGNTIS